MAIIVSYRDSEHSGLSLRVHIYTVSHKK